MSGDFKYMPERGRPLSNRTAELVVRGQYHKFMLIPPMEHHTRWFDAGPVSIGVEARALGSEDHMIRGPSIHVFDAAHDKEFVRFDIFGDVLHYHFVLADKDHNIVWGYDPDTNGPMLDWAIAALRDRLPTMLRKAGAESVAREVEQQGWDASVLEHVRAEAVKALRPRPDDLERSREGMAWMAKWKDAHPQFNTVEEGEI
jgi:hypothetical protein